eukprot:11256913-Ditylum_brightwellii.AAC.1
MALVTINQNFISFPVLMIPEIGEKVYAGIIHSSATYRLLTSIREMAHCQDKCTMANLHET